MVHATVALFVVTASSIAADQSAVMSRFVNAWDNADAASLAQQFEPKGRLVIPSGMEVTDRDAIRAFYTAAFDRGYKDSKGGAKIVRITPLARDVALIEGEWSIDGAKKPDGSPRERESGQFSAVVRKSPSGPWKIVVLREMRLAK